LLDILAFGNHSFRHCPSAGASGFVDASQERLLLQKLRSLFASNWVPAVFLLESSW